MVWFLVGPGIMILTGVMIGMGGGKWGIGDIVFWVFAGLCMGARLVDRAPDAPFPRRSYLVGILLIAGGLWLVAHFVAPLVFKGM